VKIDSLVVLAFFAVLALTVLFSFLTKPPSDVEREEKTENDITSDDERDDSESQRRSRSSVKRSIDKISKENTKSK